MPPADNLQTANTSQTPNLYPSKEKPPHKHFRTGKLLVIIGCGVVIVALGIAGRILYKDYRKLKPTSPSELQNISYTNEKGDTFHLSYYANSSTVAASQLSSLNGQGQPSNLFIRAALPDNPSLALATNISESLPTFNIMDNNFCKSDFRFNVQGENKSTIPVCGLTQNNKQLIYFAELSNGSNRYLVLMVLDYNLRQATTQLVDQIDLSKHDNDIKTILSSVTFAN